MRWCEGRGAELFRQGGLGGHDVGTLSDAEVEALNWGEVAMRRAMALSEVKSLKLQMRGGGQGRRADLSKVEQVRPRQSTIMEMVPVNEFGFDVFRTTTPSFLGHGARGRDYQFKRRVLAGDGTLEEAAIKVLKGLGTQPQAGAAQITFTHAATYRRPGFEGRLAFWKAPSVPASLFYNRRVFTA